MHEHGEGAARCANFESDHARHEDQAKHDAQTANSVDQIALLLLIGHVAVGHHLDSGGTLRPTRQIEGRGQVAGVGEVDARRV